MKRRKKYLAAPKELQGMFNEEWRRAKKLLAPALDGEPKPRLYLAKLRSNLGHCRTGDENTIAHKVNGRWVYSKHIIAISEKHWGNNGLGVDVLKTVRHEICHVPQPNHSWKFWALFKQLHYTFDGSIIVPQYCRENCPQAGLKGQGDVVN